MTGDVLKVLCDMGHSDTLVLADGDKERGMPTPAVWTEFEKTLATEYVGIELGKLGRQEFYEAAKRSYAIIQTGEEQQYGNLLLSKGYL